jgi:uncharacterized protein
MNNQFLEQADQGRNEFWRYLVTTIAMIWVAIAIQIVLVLVAFLLGGTTDIESLPVLALLLIAMIPFPFSLAALWGGLRLLHKRPLMSILNPSGKLAWKRVFVSAGLWFGLAGLSDLLLSLIDPVNYVWTFDFAKFAPYFILAIILIPIQTSTEEMIFRGYLAQWMSRYSRRLWVPLVIPSLVFMLLHGLNPEVLTYGAWLTLPFYFGIGLLLGYITLRSGGLELAIGLHAANNLYAALMVTFPSSALPSPALFTIQRYDPVLGLTVFAAMAALYLVILFVLQKKNLSRAVTATILATVLASTLVTPAQAQSYDAERFDVRIEVQADGTLLVSETIVFRFIDGPFSYAFRTLELNELDRIEVLSAHMDGTVLPPGTQPGQVEIKPDANPIEVTWYFDPTWDAIRTIDLHYRVIGNVRQAAGGDGFSWRAIPADHEYDIRFATITVVYPPGVEPLEPPTLVGQSASFETSPGQIVFHLAEIERNQFITVTGRFPPGSLLSEPPAWQVLVLQRDEQIRTTWPFSAIIAIGLFLAGLIIAEFLRRKNSIAYPQSIPIGSLSNPPDNLSPGLAAYLTANARPNALHFFAIVLDLTRRGYLRLEQKEAAGIFKAKDYQITRLKNGQGLKPQEAFVHQFLFQTRKGVREQVSLSHVGQKLGGKLSTFSKHAQEELSAAGTFMPDQIKLRERLIATGFILFFAAIALAILGAVFVMIARDNLAMVGMLLFGGSLGVLGGGIVLWLYGDRWKILTPQGKQRQERWNAFRLYIRELVKSDSVLQAEWLGDYLPFAVAFGLGDRWVKAFKDRGLSTLLKWVYQAEGGYADSMVLTAVIITSTANSGGGSAGSGGGGGASGAG